MTTEEKELLFIDLCSRIPHKTICTSKRFDKSILIGMDDDGATFSHIDYLGQTIYELLDIIDFDVKPYLRPLSSMTEEEKKVYENYYQSDDTTTTTLLVDFYNKKHFDHRGLIPIGLALEAPKDMYETKEK